MPTYIYESVPESCCQEPEHYEIEQASDAAPLTHHPETNIPIKRVVIAGSELIKDKGSCCCGNGECSNE
jgi:predicted nucleic acid-binding Zn ribbon protein